MSELLQELRVAQTGVQILFAFLLTLVFQPRFAEINEVQRWTYVVTLLLSVLTAGLLVAPAAVHRITFRRGVKIETVQLGHRLFTAGLATLAFTLSGGVLLVFDVAVGHWFAIPVAWWSRSCCSGCGSCCRCRCCGRPAPSPTKGEGPRRATATPTEHDRHRSIVGNSSSSAPVAGTFVSRPFRARTSSEGDLPVPNSTSPGAATPWRTDDGIEHERRYVGMLYEQLDARRADTARRLRDVLHDETVGTPQALTERDAAAAMYTDRLAALRAAEHGLAFGRLDALRTRRGPPSGATWAGSGCSTRTTSTSRC